MKKVRSDASWMELTEDQLKALDQWLFDEGTSQVKAWERAQAQFQYKGSLASLKRYYTSRRKQRTLEEFKDLRDEVAAISAAPGDAESLRAASMKLLGRFLFKQAQQSPEKVKEWAAVADLLVRNDYNEIVRAAKAKEHQIRENAMAFAKEKFEFDTTEQALKALPQLRALEEAKKDPQTAKYEENILWNRARWAVFGRAVMDIAPESAQEEAEMIAEKKEREARRAREAQLEREREELTTSERPPASSPYFPEYVKKRTQWEEYQWRLCAEYEI